MPLSMDEERELAEMVLKMGDYELGASLTPFRRRARKTRDRWRRGGWIDRTGKLTPSGRRALGQLLGRAGAG